MRNRTRGRRQTTIAVAAGVLAMTLGTPVFAGPRFARARIAPAAVTTSPAAAVSQAPPANRHADVKGGRIALLSPIFSAAGALDEALDSIVATVQATLQSTTRAGADCNDDSVPY